jgi:hypothetical protein
LKSIPLPGNIFVAEQDAAKVHCMIDFTFNVISNGHQAGEIFFLNLGLP